MNNVQGREIALEDSDDRAGNPTLFGRKSVLMGVAASVGVALANATLPSSATAAGTVTYAPQWTPSTAFALGQQIISPKNDVVSANVAHTSSAAYATDVAKWTPSSTFAKATIGNTGLLTSSLIVETATGVWSGDAPARTPGQFPIIFSGTSDPADPTNGIATPAKITGGDIWLRKL